MRYAAVCCQTLVAKQGLFEVTDGIYQVGGYDLSNMSVIEVTPGSSSSTR